MLNADGLIFSGEGPRRCRDEIDRLAAQFDGYDPTITPVRA